jgi:hypothetical protein
MARAQWQTTTYALKGGWNAIHLTGDAKQDTLDNLLPAGVLEVWRWNPNPTSVQFTQSPLIPAPGTPEWSVWKRGLPLESTLTQLTGQTSYLVKCSGTAATTITVPLKQSPLPPSANWVRSGANLMGFPSRFNGNYPSFTSYFATFPIATAANTKIFKYVGGELGAGNPIQIFSPSQERVDRNQAYWFSAEVVGNFTAPVQISLSANTGLTYGRTGSTITARVRNRTGNPLTLTMTPETSEAAPLGQPGVTGPVPLTRRTFDTTTAQWIETPITAAFNEVIGPQSTVEIQFGIDRGHASMTSAAADAFFASLLRVRDGGGLFDTTLPASASRSSTAGLWVGDIQLRQAGYTAAGVENTAREMPLRTLLHVSPDNTARLLSRVFIGQLAAGAHDVGLCSDESLLKADAKATAQRLTSVHLPLDRVLPGTGSVAPGSTFTCTVQVPYTDPTNPFLHQYHPDHDNKSPRGAPLPAGVESQNITRVCSFTFTAAPPPGSTASATGWGSSVIGGTYSEVLSGLHKNNITVGGTFELRRASELGILHQP